MKRKLLKTFMLAAELLAGTSAWAQITSWSHSDISYTSGQELSPNTDVVSVKLGNSGTASWTRHATYGVWIQNENYRTPTFTAGLPTAGGYIVVKPTRTLNFSLETYSTYNNGDLVMIESTNPSVELKDFRQRRDVTNDFGTLEAGKTYYIYGRNYASTAALDYIGYKGFTATTYENYTIHFKNESGTTIKDDVVRTGLYGSEVSAIESDLASIVYDGISYDYKSGNSPITLSTSGNEITLIYDWQETWTRTFDDNWGLNGFTGDVVFQNRSSIDATKVAAVFASSSAKDFGYTFPAERFSASTSYKFTFDMAMTGINNTSGTVLAEFTLKSSNDTQMFKLKSAGNNVNRNILVYIGTSSDELSKDKTGDEYKANCLYASATSGGSGTNNSPYASNWYTVTITADETNGTWVTFTPNFTQSGYGEISKKISDDVVYIGSISAKSGKYYGCHWLDNFKLRQAVSGSYVEEPYFTITAPDNNNRKFELSCSTDGATIYWATSNLAKGADGWTTYTGDAVSTASATVYAYAQKGETTSSVINFPTGAGSTTYLLPATFTHTTANTYTLTNDQSSLLGSPTATVHYQINSGEEQTSTSTSIEISAQSGGTLTYWLTATGYGATSPVDVSIDTPRTYATPTILDFCTCTESSPKWAYNDTSDGSYTKTEVTTDDNSHKYYKYVDYDGTTIGDGLFAVSAQNVNQSWRVQKNKGGTAPYGKTEYIAVLNLEAGQIVQIKCSSTPGIVSSNISAITADSYSGTYTYLVESDGDAIVSLAKNNILKKVYLCSTTVPATIGLNGYSTFASTYNLDMTKATQDANGFKAYSAKVEGNSVKFTQIDKWVNAGTGVLLEGTKGGSVTIPITYNGNDISSDNEFLVNTTGKEFTAESGYTYYGMKKATEENEDIVFAKFAPGTVAIPADKAYLKVSTTGTSRLNVVFDDATGISTVETVKAQNGETYNLSGQRVAQPQKGLYIVNGKKVIIK